MVIPTLVEECLKNDLQKQDRQYLPPHLRQTHIKNISHIIMKDTMMATVIMNLMKQSLHLRFEGELRHHRRQAEDIHHHLQHIREELLHHLPRRFRITQIAR